MSIKGDYVATVGTRLIKGNEPPPKAFTLDDESIDASTLTGETRESKAKAYAVDTINKLNGK